MKPHVIFLGFIVLVLALGGALAAQSGPGVLPAACNTGQVLEGLSLESTLLGRGVNYAVYLPPDYKCSTRRYPVVYLLHGYTDDESGWIQFGEVNVAADDGIRAGEVPAMIIVMPDGGVTWYVNDYSGKVPYEDMLLKELIPEIDRKYRTRPKREFRAVSGLSMGGYGSLMLAMRHPDVFASCVAFSAGIIPDEDVVAMADARWNAVFGAPFGPGLKGSARLTGHYQSFNPLHLAKTVSADELKKVRWYIDCGDDDHLSKGNGLLHIELQEREIPHEYRVRDGRHSWVYWRTGIRTGLRFIGEGFHR